MEKNIFNPSGDLMSQLAKLTTINAKQWYKEYLQYHKGEDQGVSYLIGYFSNDKRTMLENEFKNVAANFKYSTPIITA